MTVPDSPENKCPTVECPDCGGMGSGEGGFRGGKKWKAICPGCGGSGRINTSGDFIGDKPGLGEHSCHEDCPCSPSVPDRKESMDPFDGKDPLAITDPMEWAVRLARLVEAKPEVGTDAGTLVGWFSNFQSALEARASSLSPDRETGRDARSDSEGELRARIEAKAREYEKDAEYADASRHKAAMAQARLLRSLLVPKEEA